MTINNKYIRNNVMSEEIGELIDIAKNGKMAADIFTSIDMWEPDTMGFGGTGNTSICSLFPRYLDALDGLVNQILIPRLYSDGVGKT